MSVPATAAPSPGPVVLSPNDAVQGQPDACARYACVQQSPPEPIWQSWTHDPVALATVLLVLVTTGLWFSTFKLWRATVRLANDAKESSGTQAEKMERSIAEAASAARAMERQNEIAEDTARRQLRAYVTTEDHSIQGLWRGGTTEFQTKIWNRGQTPAYDVMIWSIVTDTDSDPDTLKIKRRTNPDFSQSRNVLGPGQWVIHSNPSQAPLGGDPYVSIVTGAITVVFAGVVTYRDAFGKRHFTIFKQFYTGSGNWSVTSADLIACGNGNNGS